MTKSLLITGGAGYIGSHVVAELLELGHRVVVLDNLSQGHREAVPAEAELIVADLLDRTALTAVFADRRFDGIIHFAANSLVGVSMKEPFRYIGDNVVAALNLIETAIAHDVRRFVLSSTCAIFGEPERLPIDEEVAKHPANPYGESKLMIERILAWADHVHGLKYAALRYFNAAGAHPTVPIGEDHAPETHLIPIALQVALGQRSHLDIYGDDYATPDGTCVRDYIHVVDLADAHIRVLDVLEQGSRLYNVGIGNGFSVREVIDSVRRVTGVPIEARIAPRRPGDPAVLVAGSQKIRRELGWAPRFLDIDEIVGTAWAWRVAHPLGYATRRKAA